MLQKRVLGGPDKVGWSASVSEPTAVGGAAAVDGKLHVRFPHTVTEGA